MPAEDTNELTHLLGPYWSATRTSRALGLNLSQVGEREEEGTLLAVRSTGGTPFFPIWQFHRRSDGTIEVKPGLLAFIRALRSVMSEGWTIGTFLRTPAPELEDLTPEQWIDQGRSQDTLHRYADALVREWERH